MSLSIELPVNTFSGLVVNTAPPTPASASRVDPATVRLLKRVAEGSSGSVWVANWNGARVRAKILHHYGVENLRFESRMTGLSHPNLVSVYGVSSHPEGPMLLMDHSDGQSLREWMTDNILHSWHATQLRTRALACIVRRLHIALQVAAGMGHLHANKIVHRDLKPDNVLVRLLSCGHPEAKVTDFGLSRDIDDNTGRAMTSTNTVRGTPSYMSPEQWRRGSVTHKADVYAYGLLVLELFSGRELTWTGLPAEFEDVKGREQAKRSWYKWLRRACLEGHVPVLPEAPASPSDLTNADGFPTVVRDVVLAALGLDPDARPSFDAICDTLRTACDVFQTELEASDARDAAEFLGSTHTPGVGGWLGDSLLMSTPRGSGGGVAIGTPSSAGRVRTPGSGSGSGSVTAARAGSSGGARAEVPPAAPVVGRSTGGRREVGEVRGGGGGGGGGSVASGEGFASPTPRPPQARRRAAAGSPAAAHSVACAPADGNPEAVAPAATFTTPHHVTGTASPRALSPQSSGGIVAQKGGYGQGAPSPARRMVGSSPGGSGSAGPPDRSSSAASPRSVTLGSPRRWAVGGLGDSGRLVSADVGGNPASGGVLPVSVVGGDWPSEL